MKTGREKKLDCLRKLAIFADLDDRQHRTLATRSELLHFSPGTPVWLAGMKTFFIFVIVEGRLNILHESVANWPTGLFTLGAGELASFAEMIRGTPSSTSALATEETTVLAICRKEIRRVLALNEDFLYQMGCVLLRHQHRLFRRLCKLNPSAAERRLSNLLSSNLRPPPSLTVSEQGLPRNTDVDCQSTLPSLAQFLGLAQPSTGSCSACDSCHETPD